MSPLWVRGVDVLLSRGRGHLDRGRHAISYRHEFPTLDSCEIWPGRGGRACWRPQPRLREALPSG